MTPRTVQSVFLFAVFIILVCPPFPAPAETAGETEGGYRVPPQELVDIVDAPPTPAVSISPDLTRLLLLELPNLPPLAELAEPELKLAGMRIKPQTNGPSRTRPFIGLTLMRIDDLTQKKVTGLPASPRIGNVSWSPDGTHISFTNTTPDGIALWVVDAENGKARPLTKPVLSMTAREPPRWMPDNRTLLCTLVPDGRGPEPAAEAVPDGPVVQQNLGRKTPARTYQDLLKNARDEALFDYYFSSRMAAVTLEGKVTPLGEPGVLWTFDPSPDGRYILVQIIHRPYSYLVPAGRFPRRVEVWDMEGKMVHRIADLPLQDQIPIAFGSVATGPRSVAWRSDVPSTLVWAEALDDGDAGKEAELRDRIYLLEAPFSTEPGSLMDLQLRFAGIDWASDDLALVSEWWWKTRKVRTWMVSPGAPMQSEPRVLFDRSFEDRYSDPGNPVTKQNASGRSVMITGDGGRTLFLIGSGASTEGDRPFLDTIDLKTKKTERRFHSEAPWYERPVELLDEKGRLLLTRRESVDQPPNYFIRDLKKGTLKQITSFPHPTPQLAGLKKEQIRYERKDGVKLTGTLYLPPGHDPENGPLPMLMWAYPQEFKSADAAGQVTDSPYRFDRVGWWSALLWLTQGYAVLDDPTLPIVGEGEVEPNDTYVEQLVAGARAAVDEVVRRGVAEEGSIAIGGHSYGAFMTANLLAYSDLFAAGIARSGAYNRTLTPFGFQSEERTLWEAPEVYFTMSPFMHAEKINEPILLIHGEADSNSGTFPLQSERFYGALKGQGATARLVMLPLESHGYRARESVLHMLWETWRWMGEYVAKKSE